ncbi:hypothetical protein H632_c1681p1 [Helicosporidium sp. ATCC 50920]|nr:hypothetical protein H632_c1681p1 [Helicosporidium sp. ATCC 50920]|eukprot:KDD73980.1 hypothetical protein H632_c1681p1 [Helicosporidium sp. ATCC 50920]
MRINMCLRERASCEDESIDEIAAFLGVGEAVAEMTSRAMGGSMLFQDALKMRLDLMAISSESMTRFLAEHPARLSPGIRELVALLHSRGVQVYLVSGGFRLVIHPIADALNIPQSNVFANTLLFNTDGSYSGFDPVEFTSRSGGKREAVAAVAARDGHETIVMVGDGATDAEARAPGAAALFVGYGGVVYREAVAQKADWYITRVQQLIDALESKSSA